MQKTRLTSTCSPLRSAATFLPLIPPHKLNETWFQMTQNQSPQKFILTDPPGSWGPALALHCSELTPRLSSPSLPFLSLMPNSTHSNCLP